MRKIFENPNFEILNLDYSSNIKTDDVLWNSIPSIHDPNETGEY